MPLIENQNIYYISQLLKYLCNNIDLYSGTSRTEFDEYRLFTQTFKPETGIKLPFYFTETAKYLPNEPRIHFLKEILLSLLICGDFYHNEHQLKITGFSLRNLASFSCKKKTSPGSIIQLFRRPCRIHCKYCYQDGIPWDFPFNVRKVDDDEILDRIRNFSKGSELFPRLIYNVDETISHPLFFYGMNILRKKTDDVFYIYTNGESLSRDNIQKLKGLMPLLLNISLTSADPVIRKEITGDKTPEIAINGIKLLYDHKIPFEVSIVAWPDIPFNDIERTISHADQYDPCYIKILFPGYSRFFKRPFPEDSDEFYKKLMDFINSIRHKYKSGLFFDLNKMEEINYKMDPLVPRINYITPNSPAYIAGLKKGHVIKSIMGRRVMFRKETTELINLASKILERNDIEITISDNEGNKRDIHINRSLCRDHYPYFSWQKNLGINIDDGLNPIAISLINKQIETFNSKNILFLSSRLMEYSLNYMLKYWIGIKNFVNFNIHIPKNYFWGGNIFIGDLLTVEDFIKAINEALEKYPETDLVIIPSSPFSQWKRDILGTPFHFIKRSFDIPVVLLPYRRMYS